MYLYQFGGISFLIDHYEAEHTLSFHEAIEDLELICKKTGRGTIVILFQGSNIEINDI